MTPTRQGLLLHLPNELIVYILSSFLDLPDVWSLLSTSKELRYFASTVIKTTWKINLCCSSCGSSGENNGRTTTLPLMKLQCRAALIQLASASDPTRERQLHANMMKGIASYKHKYVLIEDIDIRNRIRTAVDVVFHHAIFVSAMDRIRLSSSSSSSSSSSKPSIMGLAAAAVWVRLLTELDTAFPSYCREITFTCADNIKAFLEYTGYKIMKEQQQHLKRDHHITLYSLWACFDFMGAAFLGKILTDHHIECAVQRTCDLLSSSSSSKQQKQALVTFKKSLLVHFLEHWLLTCKGSGDLVRFIRLEIEKL